MSDLPKIVASIAPDSPKWLHVPAFEVLIPQETDPDTLDIFGLKVEVEIVTGKPDFKLKAIKNEDREDTGQRFRSAPRWLYESLVRPGSPKVIGYRERPQMSLFDEELEGDEPAA